VPGGFELTIAGEGLGFGETPEGGMPISIEKSRN
jgi:hypothetical protein